MKKRIFALALALMMVFQLFNFAGISKTAVAAPEDKNIVHLTKATLATDATLTPESIIAEVEQGLAPYIKTGFTLDPDNVIYLEYVWEILDDHPFIAPNNTFTFYMPAEFILDETQILTGNLDSFGQFTAYPRTAGEPGDRVVVTFNENVVEDEMGVPSFGTMHFWVYADESMAVGDELNIELIPNDADSTVTVSLQPPVIDPPDYVITKSGSAAPIFNPTHINWTIYVNTNAETITNAVVTDSVPLGLSLDINDLEVFIIDNVTGVPTEYLPTIVSYSPGGPLTINLGDIDSAYRIEYVTEITNHDLSQFINSAELSGDETGLPVDDDATVTPNRGELLNKSALFYDAATETIKWQIRYNFGLKTQPSSQITDVFDSRHEFVPDSLYIYEANSVTGNSNFEKGADVTADWDTIDVTGNIITLELASSTNKAFVVEYETKLKSDVFIYTNTTFSNTVTANGSDPKPASQDVSQRFFHKSSNEATPGNKANYESRTISWAVDINEVGYDIKDVVYSDEFTDGQTLLLDTLQIRINNDPVMSIDDAIANVPGIELTLVGAAGIISGFTLSLPDGDDRYRITYTSRFDYDVDSDDTLFNTYNNEGSLNYTDIHGPQPALVDKNNSATLNQNAINNGYKDGSYNAATKEITWDILINYNSKRMNDVVVTDVIESIQTLNLASITVSPTTILSNGDRGALLPSLTEGDPGSGDYTVDYDEATKLLTISFNDTIEQPYFITFKTNVEQQQIDIPTIENTAVFSAADPFDPKEYEADVTINNASNFLEKDGNQVPGSFDMEWELIINLSQSHLYNVVITDTPSNNQILFKDTFKLYQAEVDSNGNIINKVLVPFDTADFVLRFDDENDPSMFWLEFSQISRPYVLEYTSMFDEDEANPGAVTVSNTAHFSGFAEGSTIESAVDSDGRNFQFNLAGAGGSGNKPQGDLRVVKFDANYPSLALENVEFELRRPNGVVSRSGLFTDEFGILEVTDLTYGKYILVETTPLAGYVPMDPVPFSVNGPELEIEVFNERQTGDLEVTKVVEGNHSTLLPGAEFVLYNEDKSIEIGRLTTESDEADPAFGKVLFEDLPFGTYILKEVKAPTGYQIIGNGEHTIVIEPNDVTVITVENRRFIAPPFIPYPTPSEEPETTEEPVETEKPEPTPTPTPAPTPTPTPGVTPAPTPTPQTEKTTEETPVEGEVEVSEEDDVKIGTPPSNGKVTVLPNGKWTYTPDPGFVGKDRFSIIIINENGEEEEIWIDIDVEEVPRGTVEETPDVDKLPKTGQSSYLLLYLLGAALIGGGIALSWRKRNKEA